MKIYNYWFTNDAKQSSYPSTLCEEKKNARQITLQLKYVKLMNTIIIHAEYLANTQELVDMLINMLGGCKILTWQGYP